MTQTKLTFEYWKWPEGFEPAHCPGMGLCIFSSDINMSSVGEGNWKAPPAADIAAFLDRKGFHLVGIKPAPHQITPEHAEVIYMTEFDEWWSKQRDYQFAALVERSAGGVLRQIGQAMDIRQMAFEAYELGRKHKS